MLLVFFEQLGDHNPLFIMDFRCFFQMLAKEGPVVFFDVMIHRDWYKRVPSDRTYLILYCLSEHSHKQYYTHHFFIRTFCESKDYNYHMPHKTCG